LTHTVKKNQLNIRSNKKIIAKKPLTNLYEMNSSVMLALVLSVYLLVELAIFAAPQ